MWWMISGAKATWHVLMSCAAVSSVALLAQVPTPDPAGSAGWITAIGTSGVAVAFGVVLRWLLWTHLPAKDKMVLDLVSTSQKAIDDRDREYREGMERQRADHRTVIDLLLKANEDRMKGVLDHCDREMARRDGAAAQQQEELRAVIIDLRRAIEEAREDNLGGRQDQPKPPKLIGGS